MLLHHGYLALPHKRPADLDRLNAIFCIYKGASPVDRTGTIVLPTRIKSIFPIPQMRDMRKTYKQLCAERAIALSQLAIYLDIPVYVSWSGGIDSTCALISLLEHCQEPKRITVLLDENSIREYPLFFSQHIHGKLNYQPANLFRRLLATKNLLISGEHNDQLFGSDIIGDAITLFGIDAVLGRLQRELFTSLFEIKLNGNRQIALFLSGLLGRLIETAPVPLRTNFDLMWWINFALKWQTVFMRSLIFSENPLSPASIATFYKPFFNTAEFQLWSMNNLDQRIRKDWRSYKWPAKEIIYEFTKDADYRDNKIKRGSLQYLFLKNPRHHTFLDENFAFHQNIDWYQSANDLSHG